MRWLLGILLLAAAFAAGVALGEALHDNPKPGITVTTVRTLHP
jgi:predicted outer membrane lipoprotein